MSDEKDLPNAREAAIAWSKAVPAEPEDGILAGAPLPSPSPTEAMMAALEAWDRLFVWAEPFEGYDEEKALHNAFVALKASEGAAAHSPKETL